MKILFILPEYYPHSGGGISSYYLQYIRALQGHCDGIKVIVGSGYTQSDDVFNKDGIEIEYLKPSVYRQYLKLFGKYDLFPEFRNNLAAAWAMWDQAQRGDGFDIIECTDFGLGFTPWLLRHKQPVVVRLHGSSGQIALHEPTAEHVLTTHLFQSAELGMIPLSDALISHSTYNAGFWNDLLNQQKAQVIYPAYQAENTPLPIAGRDEFGLVTARIQKWKGAEELCRAMQLLEKPPLVKWFGRDMYLEGKLTMSQYLAANYPDVYNNKILFEQQVPQQQIHQLQHKAKFGLAPSTWDMFNFTVLEFMATGTPVICAEGAGAAELIENGKNGFKYPPNDINALAQLIEQVNTINESQYLEITQNAIETIKTILAPEYILKTNLELYQAALKNFAPNPANRYLNEMYSPEEKRYTIDEVLDKQAFKVLKDYFFKRIKSKLLK